MEEGRGREWKGGEGKGGEGIGPLSEILNTPLVKGQGHRVSK